MVRAFVEYVRCIYRGYFNYQVQLASSLILLNMNGKGCLSRVAIIAARDVFGDNSRTSDTGFVANMPKSQSAVLNRNLIRKL